MLQCLLLVTNLARQYHCSSVCWDWFWARRPYWHHLLAQLSGLMCPHCHLITMIISPGELWVEQGLLCQRLGQGCLWQGGRVPGNICHNTRCILSQNIGPIKLLVYLVICQMLNHSSENIRKFVWSIIEWLWWLWPFQGGAERGVSSYGERRPVPGLAESHQARKKVPARSVLCLRWRRGRFHFDTYHPWLAYRWKIKWRKRCKLCSVNCSTRQGRLPWRWWWPPGLPQEGRSRAIHSGGHGIIHIFLMRLSSFFSFLMRLS